MDFLTHWMITLGVGYFLGVCGFVVWYLEARSRRRSGRPDGARAQQ